MKISNRQQLIAILAIAGVVLLAGDKILFKRLTHYWSGRADQITDLGKKISQGKLLLQREQGIRRRWTEMKGNTLPNDTSVAEQRLLRAFDQWAQESRISVTAITPQWKRDSEDYMLLECRVDALGNLGTITRFLYNIERDPMGLKLEAVQVSARDNEGQQIALGLQISGLVLTSQSK
jgi:hypothetical protein